MKQGIFEPNKSSIRLMQAYAWQKIGWPQFTYGLAEADKLLLRFSETFGHVNGLLTALPDHIKTETLIELMLAEAIKTSEIEGEYLSRQDVLSSIKKNLGLALDAKAQKNKSAKGIADLMIDVRTSFAEPLTAEKLFGWHRMLMAGRSDISIGQWRTHAEPMQVISGHAGKQKVHFEAPPSAQVPAEMHGFIQWFNRTAPDGESPIVQSPVRAAIAHLYFESIHPFEDGNGRIGRAIAEKSLSQSLGRPVLLSLSKTIEAAKHAYYAALQKAQRSFEITPWIIYFLNVVLDAQTETEQRILFTLKKTTFFDTHRHNLIERQRKALERMFEEGPAGFKGGMNAGKYTGITKTSKATATRDLQHLTAIGALIPSGGGRSTSYQLNLL